MPCLIASEPWESGEAAPFLWIETPQGNVEVWRSARIGSGSRHPGGHEQLVTGFEEAERTADALAGALG